MSRVNHACGSCGHMAERHATGVSDGEAKTIAAATRCSCCKAGTFDAAGPITVVPTYDVDGRIEERHYSPGERRHIGGPPHRTHICDGCVAVDQAETRSVV